MFEDVTPNPSAVPSPVPPAEARPETGALPASEPAVLASPPEETLPGPAEQQLEEETHDEVADWKDALRRDFESWLAGLEEMPELEEAGTGAAETPDLYSFYEQLVAANTETRKANRRTAEALSQWGEALARFEGSLTPLRESVAQLAGAQPKEGRMSRAHCLVLVEWLDRLHRIARAFQSPPAPKTSWWGGSGSDAAWRKAWETQRQAFGILVSHVEELLKKEGVTRLDTLGQPFDPAVMTAVAAEPDATRPPQTVIEELAAGYRRHGELLRPAQVKVTRAT
jgi:hypothetical protein